MLFSLVGTLGCKAGSPKDAAQFGDIVLVAIPLENHRSIPVEPLPNRLREPSTSSRTPICSLDLLVRAITSHGAR
jgi:hypothetical protein